MTNIESPAHRGLSTVRDAPSRLRPQFLVTFTLLGVLVVAALVYVVGAVMSNDIRKEQVDGARERAELLAQASFAPRLQGPLSDHSARKLRALDARPSRLSARATCPRLRSGIATRASCTRATTVRSTRSIAPRRR